jgi:hypothetical protein
MGIAIVPITPEHIEGFIARSTSSRASENISPSSKRRHCRKRANSCWA